MFAFPFFSLSNADFHVDKILVLSGFIFLYCFTVRFEKKKILSTQERNREHLYFSHIIKVIRLANWLITNNQPN